MAYTVIDDWRGGLDHRRLPAVASPTTLRTLTNAHINEGGEIEKRKAFVHYVDASLTFGLASANGQLYVFGSDPSPLPAGSVLQYQQLVTGTGVKIDAVEDWDLFDGKLYVVGLGSDLNYYHFYDGVLVPTGSGRRVKTLKEKVYGILNKDVSFSATGDPTDWTGTGSGTINLSTQDADSLDLEGIEIYYNQLAFLSPRTAQFWTVASDPTSNSQAQVLRAAGTRAGRSTRQFGNGDVLYLDSTGVRSLRARDDNVNAGVSDVGSPIDPILKQLLIDDAAVFGAARSAIEVGAGRYWLSVGPEIYVLSYFPTSKITAWSVYVPEQGVADMVGYDLGVAVRGTDDQIYLYGGVDYNAYDQAKVTAITPFLNAGTPATPKAFSALDVAGENVWKVEANLAVQPKASLESEANWDTVGVFDGTTFDLETMGFEAEGTHVAFRMTCEQPGPAVLANLVFHYREGSA